MCGVFKIKLYIFIQSQTNNSYSIQYGDVHMTSVTKYFGQLVKFNYIVIVFTLEWRKRVSSAVVYLCFRL